MRPMAYIAKQNPRPAPEEALESPVEIILKKSPRTKPPKFPTAKRNPTAEPSPTGKTNQQPNSSIMGTSGIKKKLFNADIKLAITKF